MRLAPILILPLLALSLLATGCDEEIKPQVEPGSCWVYSATSNRLNLINDSGELRVIIKDPGKVVALAADTADGAVWLIDLQHRRLVKYSHEGLLLKMISGFVAPLDVAVHPETRDVYVLDASEAKVVVFNRHGEPLWRLDTPPAPSRLILGGRSDARLLLAAGMDWLACYDAVQGEELWRVELPYRIRYHLDAGQDSDSFWLSDGETLQRRSLDDGGVRLTYTEAREPLRLGALDSGCWVYDNETAELRLINDQGERTARIRNIPGVPELGGTGDRLWVIVESADLVALYDDAGDSVVRTTSIIQPRVLGAVR